MSQFSATSFGLMIAYFIPGLIVLVSAAKWIPQIEKMFLALTTANSSLGLTVLMVMLAVPVGLFIAFFRMVVFELLLRRWLKQVSFDWKELSQGDSLGFFRAAIDENYRYYQFYGGIAVVLPLLFVAWGSSIFPVSNWIFKCGIYAGIEAIAVWSAIDAFVRFRQKTESLRGRN